MWLITAIKAGTYPILASKGMYGSNFGTSGHVQRSNWQVRTSLCQIKSGHLVLKGRFVQVGLDVGIMEACKQHR